MRSTGLILLIMLVVASTATAQTEPPYRWAMVLKQKTAHAGDLVTVSASVAIDPTWHIYSTKSYGDDGPLPTSFDITPANYFAISGTIKQTKPQTKTDEAFQIVVEFFEGKATFSIPVRVSAKTPVGKQVITVKATAMACDNKMCMPPKTKSFDLPIVIEVATGKSEVVPVPQSTEPPVVPPATKTAAAVPAPQAQTAAPNTAGGLPTNVSAIDNIKQRGLLWFIGFAMTMGFLALLTPCVFPMIPLTVSFFTKHTAKEHHRGISDVFLYGLGIVLTYTALGFLFSLVFGATSLSSLAANPYVNIVFGLIFVVLALNLFGVFEIGVPTGLVNLLNRKTSGENSRNRGSLLLMGLTFTLTSFTCTVPFIGTVMVAASRGEYIWPLVGMLSFSTAFALPFMVLALFPHAIHKLPRSGTWMNSMKVVLGFLELAAVIKFISNADLVFGWEFFTRDVFLSTWIAISGVLSLYLLGIVKFHHDSADVRVGTGRLFLSIFFITGALFFYTGINGVPLGTIDAYLPPREYGIKERLNTTPIPLDEAAPASKDDSKSGTRRQAKGPEWGESYQQALIDAKAQHKNVFIDFTGYTCTNCRWMESNVFNKPLIDSMLRQFVLVRLYTDGDGDNYAANQKMEETRFGTVALPLYAIMTSDDKPVAVFAKGMTRDLAEFQGFLQSGVPALVAMLK